MKKSLSLIIFFFSLISNSQSIILKGIVKDTLKKPVPYTNVIAKPKSLNGKMEFFITDDNGYYILRLNKNENYDITFSHIGFKKIKFNHYVQKDEIKNIFLEEEKNLLDEVLIDLPILVKKDTIIYNPEKFLNGNERKLKNVLQKLPGIEVSRDGDITFNGKKITKLLVENKKFFGGGTKLGVENIPSDVIHKVEIIDNYNEISFLKGISDSNEMAINIKLKEEKKNFAFGDLKGGLGKDNFYTSKANLFYYTPKSNINFIGSLNNSGDKVFTFKDYLNFSGGVNAVFESDFKSKSKNLIEFLKESDILRNKEKIGALNLSNTIGNKLDLSGYLIISNNKTENLKTEFNKYSFFTENKNSSEGTNNFSAISQFNLEYNPSNNENFKFSSFIKKSNIQQNENTSTDIASVLGYIGTFKKFNILTLNHNIEWHKKNSDLHTFSSAVNYTFDKTTPMSKWNLSSSFANSIKQIVQPIDTTQNNLLILNQNQIEKHNVEYIFKSYWLINSNNHLYTTITNSYENSQFQTYDFQLLDNGDINNFKDFGFNNHVKLYNKDISMGLHYKFKSGIFTLKQGAYLHNYDWTIEQNNYSLNKNKWIILPDFSLLVEFNEYKTINLNYNLKTNFADISDLTDRLYLTNYNSLYRGNSLLENELFHSLNFNYKRFNLFRGFMFLLNTNYAKKAKGYNNTINFNGITNFSSLNLMNNAEESLSINTVASKKIKKIKYKLNISYIQSIFNQIVNDIGNSNKTQSFKTELSAKSTYKNFPDIEIGMRNSINNYKSKFMNSRFIITEPFIKFEGRIIKYLVANFDFTGYNYINRTENIFNTFNTSNMSLTYQNEKSPWSYSFEVKNIFNTKFKRTNNSSNYAFRDIKEFIMPRVIMISLNYKL